jgi:hypothetical protein
MCAAAAAASGGWWFGGNLVYDYITTLMCLRGIGASQFLSWIWAVNRHGEVGRSVLFVSSPLLSSPLCGFFKLQVKMRCFLPPVALWLLVVLVHLFLRYWFLCQKKDIRVWSTEAFLQLEICTLSLSLSHTHTQSLHPLFLLCACNQSKGQIELGVSSGYLLISFFLSFFLSLLIYLYFLYL